MLCQVDTLYLLRLRLSRVDSTINKMTFAKIFPFLLIGVAGIILWGWIMLSKQTPLTKEIPSPSSSPSAATTTTVISEAITVLATNLEVPWAIAFLSDNNILLTERAGRLRIIKAGQLDPTPVATITDVKQIGEGGLLGLALHPDFSTNHYVYLYYTYSSTGDNTLNRVVRYTFENDKLNNKTVIVDQIPGASNHNGGRIKFGPDKYLYITTGDAENPSQAQNTNTLGGKILRVTADGQKAPGNPFGNLVYSYGHRNPQGIAWDSGGSLWETEHGRSGVLSGFDEINLITPGKNYGWPTIQGAETKTGMVTPKQNSGSTTTWAPAGTAFIGNSLFFGGLRGQTLYEAKVTADQVTTIKEHLGGKFGRIREVIVGPDGMLYITTSNRDGRGILKPDDDKLIRINPSLL